MEVEVYGKNCWAGCMGGPGGADRLAKHKDSCPNIREFLASVDLDLPDDLLSTMSSTETLQKAINKANISCTTCGQKPLAHQSFLNLA